MRKIRALVVDDSSFMRTMVKKMLTKSGEIEVIASAVNGKEGVDMAIQLRPDIITMDIEMPVMDGLEAVAAIMKQAPTSIIMLSTLTTNGATATLKAMELGAVDFIPKEIEKSIFNIENKENDLVTKIKKICRNKVILPPSIPKKPETKTLYQEPEIQEKNKREELRGFFNVLVIGSSTGGPKALNNVIPHFPKNISYPILMVQHMPKVFTGPLAKRLDEISNISVKEAEHGEPLQRSVAYIAPGGQQMLIKNENMKNTINLTENIQSHLHCPSVDVMMTSAANVYQNKTLGIMMTGMGQDGINGFREIKNKGGMTIAQDRETSVVYGMPRAVVEAGLVDSVVPLEKITETVLSIRS
ncbi:MAG: chemotaxis response regulator protein-glutamate methylesterase [Nitrospinae bacterium]|nr:chemotaxis response regulator protein-glutamate methylesterase [Nitrospinota bacterium]